MTEHTNLPWRVEEGTDLIWGACNPDDLTSWGMGYSIMVGQSMRVRGDTKPSITERMANAEYVCRVVNSQSEIVAALQLGLEAVLESFDHAETADDLLLADARHRAITSALALAALSQPSAGSASPTKEADCG